MNRLLILILLLLIPNLSLADTEQIADFSDKTLPVLNDTLRDMNNNTNGNANNIAAIKAYFTGGILNSIAGGTNSNLSLCTQGSIVYFSSTGVMSCLAPSTSGYFLKTQGASANPIFDATQSISNVLFQYNAIVPGDLTLATGVGEIIGSSANPTVGGTWRFLENRNTQNTYVALWKTKWIKIAGISTITTYAQAWAEDGAGLGAATFKIDVGGINNTVSSGHTTVPVWVNTTLNVSSLIAGTAYDVTVSVAQTGAAGTNSSYLGNIISFGS